MSNVRHLEVLSDLSPRCYYHFVYKAQYYICRVAFSECSFVTALHYQIRTYIKTLEGENFRCYVGKKIGHSWENNRGCSYHSTI